ncbi:MAG: hypothetical protein ABIK44_02045 [candidate division WOR-3 bacterium]
MRVPLVRLVTGLAAAGSLLLPGCGNRPPSVPKVWGASRGQPSETLFFRVRSGDRNGGNLAFCFDWGDGGEPEWSPEVPSGESLSWWKVYKESGSYGIRVKARDETGLESDWSEPFLVRVEFLGPLPPSQPEGPERIYPDTFVSFAVVCGHVRDESVSVQFDWGETVGGWSRFVGSGAVVRDSHSFQGFGVYRVRARARDRAGNVSPWSVPREVVVGYRPLEPPTGLRLSASSGVYVKLRWNRGQNHDSVRFAVWFRHLDSAKFALVETTAQTFSIHDPWSATGDYTVSARFGSEELFAQETLTTIPVFTDTVVLHELNAPGLAGYGWDSLTRLGQARSMLDSGLARLVDFYFTDFTPGFSGPSYYVASPHLGPSDPGGLVPPGSWRRGAFFGLWGGVQDPLPEFDSTTYRSVVDVTTLRANLAAYLPEGFYALVSTFEPNPVDGSVKVVAWFQRVKGLRLIRHRE